MLQDLERGQLRELLEPNLSGDQPAKALHHVAMEVVPATETAQVGLPVHLDDVVLNDIIAPFLVSCSADMDPSSFAPQATRLKKMSIQYDPKEVQKYEDMKNVIQQSLGQLLRRSSEEKNAMTTARKQEEQECQNVIAQFKQQSKKVDALKLDNMVNRYNQPEALMQKMWIKSADILRSEATDKLERVAEVVQACYKDQIQLHEGRGCVLPAVHFVRKTEQTPAEILQSLRLQRSRSPRRPVKESMNSRTPPRRSATASTEMKVPSTPGRVPSTPGRVPSTPGRVPSTPGRLPSTPGRLPSTPGRLPSTPAQVSAAPEQPSRSSLAQSDQQSLLRHQAFNVFVKCFTHCWELEHGNPLADAKFTAACPPSIDNDASPRKLADFFEKAPERIKEIEEEFRRARPDIVRALSATETCDAMFHVLSEPMEEFCKSRAFDDLVEDSD